MLFNFLKFSKVQGHFYYKEKAEEPLILLLNCHDALLHVANILNIRFFM